MLELIPTAFLFTRRSWFFDDIIFCRNGFMHTETLSQYPEYVDDLEKKVLWLNDILREWQLNPSLSICPAVIYFIVIHTSSRKIYDLYYC